MRNQKTAVVNNTDQSTNRKSDWIHTGGHNPVAKAGFKSIQNLVIAQSHKCQPGPVLRIWREKEVKEMGEREREKDAHNRR